MVLEATDQKGQAADRVDNMSIARYRAETYRMLSSVFALEPTQESLDHMITMAQSIGEKDYVRSCEEIIFSYLRTLNKGKEGEKEAREEQETKETERAAEEECSKSLCTKIRTEYAELFVGPRSPLAPLYESIYLGFPHRLYTETTNHVRSFYELHGLAVIKRNRIPDDHIAYELEFMAALCERECEAIVQSDFERMQQFRKAQATFLKQHLGEWTPLFAERISQAWCADYYAVWSRFLEAFVKEDEEMLRLF